MHLLQKNNHLFHLCLTMNTDLLLQIRLHNQLLAGKNTKQPHEIVAHMGAMQSQNFDLARWAIGVRSQDLTLQKVEKEIHNGKIIRTHILRPTWHFIAAGDYHWMIALSGPRIKPAFEGYCKMVGAEANTIRKHFSVVEKVLAGKHLTRQEITEHLNGNGIKADASLTGLIMSMAEIEGWVCSGKPKGNKQTYAFTEERIPQKSSPISKEESSDRLARRFFTSHGPATPEDFIWWSGLRISEAKQAIEGLKDEFICETCNGRSFWLKRDTANPPAIEEAALLLSPFDEFVVSYKDRSELIPPHHYGKVMTKNGLFSPTVMHHGEIVGSWKKTVKKRQVEAELSFFEKTGKKYRDLFTGASARVKKFYES